MLRVIVRTVDNAAAASGCGPAETSYRTFDIVAPEIEAFMREPGRKNWSFVQREIIGVELVKTNCAACGGPEEDHEANYYCPEYQPMLAAKATPAKRGG